MAAVVYAAHRTQHRAPGRAAVVYKESMRRSVVAIVTCLFAGLAGTGCSGTPAETGTGGGGSGGAGTGAGGAGAGSGDSGSGGQAAAAVVRFFVDEKPQDTSD